MSDVKRLIGLKLGITMSMIRQWVWVRMGIEMKPITYQVKMGLDEIGLYLQNFILHSLIEDIKMQFIYKFMNQTRPNFLGS